MKDSKQMYIFLAKAGVMYLLYQAFVAYFLQTNGPLNHFVTYNIANFGSMLLRVLGYDSTAATIQNQYNVIFLNGKISVSIEDGCNGVVLMALFAGFVIAYPGPVMKKLWYIPAGLVAIYLLNIIRVVALVINQDVSKGSFDFNHKYTFTTTLYAFIFGLWMLWANKFAKITELDGEGGVESGTVKG